MHRVLGHPSQLGLSHLQGAIAGPGRLAVGARGGDDGAGQHGVQLHLGRGLSTGWVRQARTALESRREGALDPGQVRAAGLPGRPAVLQRSDGGAAAGSRVPRRRPAGGAAPGARVAAAARVG